jgi:hypothetical protein
MITGGKVSMKTNYYLSPTLKSTQQISEDLHEVGINDLFIHVVSKDETGLKKERIHSSNYLETLDLLRNGGIGALIGFIIGVFAAGALMYFKPFGPNIPEYVYLIVIVFFTLFGTWEGGLAGVACENRKLAKFHNDLEEGKYLILIYVWKSKEKAVKDVMASKHPEAQLVATDIQYFNPFCSIKRLEN